jgi:hypothetical protein
MAQTDIETGTKKKKGVGYRYPLHLRFRLVALAPRIIVTDSDGEQVLYVHQKTFKLKEDIRIYTDESKSREIYRINADRIMDISAKYHFTEANSGKQLGYTQPKALRSIWRATYIVYDANGTPTHHIKEDNPWVKIGDALLGEIPFVGIFTGFFLHPSYTAYRGGDTEDLSQPVAQIKKESGFFEGVFTINSDTPMSGEEEARVLLAFLLVVQFMRRRG